MAGEITGEKRVAGPKQLHATDGDEARLPEQKEAERNHQLLSLAAAERGEILGRMPTGPAAVIARNFEQREEERKRKEYEGELIRASLDAMRRRLEEMAKYWGEKADAGERKLGGLSGIANALGVTRPAGMSDEDFRRYLNELILQRAARGELYGNSDLVVYARDRQREYDALERLHHLDLAEDEAERTGDHSKLHREMDAAHQLILLDYRHRDEVSDELEAELKHEIIQRHETGDVEVELRKSAATEDAALDNFFGLEETEFATSARTLGLANQFVVAAEGDMSTNTPKPTISQNAKPKGMILG